MLNERFPLQLVELLDPLAYEPVHIFHVHISTCFKLSAYIVNFLHRVNKTPIRDRRLRVIPLVRGKPFG
jgi:hypothetical protein